MDDAEARQELLESWAAEQQQASRPPAPPPSRAKRVLLPLANKLVAKSMNLANRVLDRGLDTAVTSTEPEHEHPDRVRYVPSFWHVLPRALRYTGVSDSDVFVDFGCGKGRIVHQAARRPFRRVIGVEISPALAEIARATVAARRHQYRCRDVQIVVSDVMDYPVPDDLTIGYFFHPFKDEAFETVLRGIIDSIDRHPRRVRLIYLFPVQDSQILATGRFRRLTMQRNRLLDNFASQVAIYESR